MFNLKDIVSALTGHQISPLDVRFSGAVIDSRKAIEGSLFIALPGERVNGHDYVQSAFVNGARAALVDQDMPATFNTLDLRQDHFNPVAVTLSLPICLRVENTLSALQKFAAYWRDKHPVRTIGITGSVGKTSTKELIASLLSEKYTVLKNRGNRNNEIGLPLTLLELEDHHNCAVLEMGFYVPGEIRTLCDIASPQVGVITNIGTVHAERAGSQEVIARGKAELVESLPPDPDGIAILNVDDPWVKQMSAKTRASIVTYGIIEKADLNASAVKTHGLEGLSCTLSYQGQEHAIRSPLLGEFSVYTILRAASVALVEGLDWDTIVQGLSVSRVDLRMHHITLPNGAVVLDDTYNASPASTIAALKLLHGLKGRRVAILGDMLELGAYEESGHQSVGEYAATAADSLILVGERSKITAEAALQNGFPKKQLEWYPDSQTAAEATAASIHNGDIVLIKGSNSMQMDRILAALEEKS